MGYNVSNHKADVMHCCVMDRCGNDPTAQGTLFQPVWEHSHHLTVTTDNPCNQKTVCCPCCRFVAARLTSRLMQNLSRVPKLLQSANKQPCEPIGILRSNSGLKEAESVAQHICGRHLPMHPRTSSRGVNVCVSDLKAKGFKYEEIAILYRSFAPNSMAVLERVLCSCKKDSYLVQEELKKLKIPLVWSAKSK